MRFLTLFLLLAWLPPAFGHDPAAGANVFSQWTFEPWVVVCLSLSLFLYGIGALRLGARMRLGRGRLGRQCLCFLGGWLALAAALVSPLDALGGWLFSAHMLQHELLMIVAAPLLVLGRPLGMWLWAWPVSLRQAMGTLSNTSVIATCWHAMTYAPAAWITHAAVLWLWHVPRLFQAALFSDGIHVAQHLSFFLSALLFWWSVIGESALRPSRGGAMISLFTTMLHTGALGALLTVSDTLWYPAYRATSSAMGFDPLEDQQLGGLIMWVPGALAYVAAGLALGAQWLMRDAPAAGVSALSRKR